jgi:hypothetical protein
LDIRGAEGLDVVSILAVGLKIDAFPGAKKGLFLRVFHAPQMSLQIKVQPNGKGLCQEPTKSGIAQAKIRWAKK